MWAAAVAIGMLACVPGVAIAHEGPTTDPAAAEETALSAIALGFGDLINETYAYADRLPGGRFALTDFLEAEAAAVKTERDLLAFAERAVLLLADHHAITGSSFANSWAIVPSYADLWVERDGAVYRVTSVRPGSPATEAGVEPGMLLTAIGIRTTQEAVDAFWRDLGTTSAEWNAGFAARVLAAGRRNRDRDLTFAGSDGGIVRLTLPSLYEAGQDDRLEVSVGTSGDALTLKINNSLGQSGTVAAFDNAMAAASPNQKILIDLSETPGGGNTNVARGIMGWFAREPTPYQMHALPAEQRATGIMRSWIELVSPRAGKYHGGPVEVRVGRWTGSMGEGLALGLRELGACVSGEPMAGLLGAITDIPLGDSGLIVKIPTERLMSVDGLPREDFVPAPSCP